MAPLLPSTRLYACPTCREHVRSEATTCPHCGADLPDRNRFGRAASAALVGLALTGCPDKDNMTTIEPEYGVATTEPMTTGNSTGAGTESGSGSDATSAGTGTGTSMTGPEPEYGVPTTDATTGMTGTTTATTTATSGEPEYGVPSTTSGPEPDYGVPGTTSA